MKFRVLVGEEGHLGDGRMPLGRGKERVKEDMCGRGASRRGGLEQTKRECLDRERWRLFCRGHPLLDIP